MQRRKSWLIRFLIVSCPCFAGGCVDAVSEGAAEGIRDSIAAIVVSIFESASGLGGT